MAKKTNISTITPGDIKRRHPRYLTCETDGQYAALANDIYSLMHEELTFMEDREVRNASISLALYFEDLHSETHQFETFTRLYKQMFGLYLPFYHTVDATDASARLDSMRFVLWHSIVAEREGRMLNPTNDALAAMAQQLLCLWDEKKKRIDPNEELADLLYAEETQQEANMVKTVLIWLSQRSFLGRWFTNPDVKGDAVHLKQLVPSIDKETLEYANECFTVQEHQAWPLSLTPQSIYAEMIRIDMDDPDDPIAAAIEHIEWKPFGIYEVVGCDDRHIQLRDFMGDTFSVANSDFMGNVRQLVRQNTHIAGSFIAMNGSWELNGPCLWTKPSPKQYNNYLEKERQHHHMMNDFRGQYDDFIRKHNGERLYFFANAKEFTEWQHSELGLDTSEVNFPLPDEDEPQAVFFEDNGQMTLTPQARSIKHPANHAYDRAYAEENALVFVTTESCSPGMLFYMLEHQLLPDAMVNDMRGRDHARSLTQENIEFIARCMRRDIKSTQVFRQRTDFNRTSVDAPATERYDSKLPYERFVELLAAEKSILSKANKEWRVVRANKTNTVIRDVANRLEFTIATHDLYEAHLNLAENEIQVSALAPFVSRQNAPAASALLYNVVGQGRAYNAMRKYAKEFFKNMKRK